MMSSGTSTESPVLPAAAPVEERPQTRAPGGRERRGDTMEPWQLFTLAGLIGATLVVFLARGQSPAAVMILSFIIFGAAVMGLAALRMVAPLAGIHQVHDGEPLGTRARMALEREKALVLRSIKELEFDHAMGKVSDADFAEMSGRLRVRAAGLLRQLDEGGEYREAIARDIERRLLERPTVRTAAAPAPKPAAAPAASQACGTCETQNDPDARFCKSCGTALRPMA